MVLVLRTSQSGVARDDEGSGGWDHEAAGRVRGSAQLLMFNLILEKWSNWPIGFNKALNNQKLNSVLSLLSSFLMTIFYLIQANNLFRISNIFDKLTFGAQFTIFWAILVPSTTLVGNTVVLGTRVGHFCIWAYEEWGSVRSVKSSWGQVLVRSWIIKPFSNEKTA